MLSNGGEATGTLEQGRRDEARQGYGAQEWPDGSKYEGQYCNGLKHGTGRFTWNNGEYYEGMFYQDYRHGKGLYTWPSGSTFAGKFYMNKKEGYGVEEFPDGSTFKGLYQAHQRFGPGVFTYPDGRQDVGLWHRDHLVRLCSCLEGGFSLSSLPGYAAYMGPPAATASLNTPSFLSKVTRPVSKDPLRSPSADSLSEELFNRRPGLEFCSVDDELMASPPGFRQELDRCFFGELWEPELDVEPALSARQPWQLRMQAHIRRHRREAVQVGWDVSAVLSLSRDPFGPKGPLELSSEMLIQKACVGDQQAVSRILRTRWVSPDVSDAGGHTPLIAATVNCHDAVLHLLLDMGADIDMLNSEGMNALAVCHVLYYPFRSLHNTIAEGEVPPTLEVPPTQVEPAQADSPHSCLSVDMDLHEQHEDIDHSTHDDGQQGGVRGPESGEEVPGEVRCLEVLDGHIPLGSVPWRVGGARVTRGVSAAAESGQDCAVEDNKDVSVFDSARSLESFYIPVKEDGMQHTAEALSRIGVPYRTPSQETVRKMAAMKTEHRARWSTLRLLLQRGADPNRSGVPMPVLFLAIKAAHVEAVRALLLCGARTDTPLPSEWRGLYPLHVAAGLPGPEGPRITELLLHALTDPDAQAQDQHVAFHLDTSGFDIAAQTGTEPQPAHGNKSLAGPPWGPNAENGSPSSEAPAVGGRTALHVACQRTSDYSNSREVVELLLVHRARTDLLWSGHSPLSLAIASGNDMAVEALLKGGADPNLPLSRRVGSALCALSNIQYDSSGPPHDRAKLLDMLVEAGADVLRPVLVGDGQRAVCGTAVDYAHYTFNQDQRIAHTSYHALSQPEKETYTARGRLLSMMGDLLRREARREERAHPGATHTERFVYVGGGASAPRGRRPGGGAAQDEAGPESSLDCCDTDTGGVGEPADSKAAEQRHPGASSVKQRARMPLRWCYHCGRSVFVTLTPCSRCHHVLYCSASCKLRAWGSGHKDECIRLPGTSCSSQQNVRVKFSRALSVTKKAADHINPSENYSFI